MSDTSNYDATRNVEYIVSRVAQRGWSHEPEGTDNFTILRRDKRFREAQITALYEEYFPPRRHEFEWQVLEEIVRVVVVGRGASAALRFIAESVAGGVIGNAAYDAIKSMCSNAASLFRNQLGQDATERAEGFEQIGKDSERVKLFFESHDLARIVEIENETGVPRERLYPLLKLAGCIHYRRGDDQCCWKLPPQEGQGLSSVDSVANR